MRTWLVTAILLAVMASPILTETSVLEESGDNLRYSSPIQATISPSSGWTSGGEAITITGSGFSDLAFSNITDDGINHQWVEATADYTDQAGRYNAIVMDSNGHLHVVHINGGNYQIRHSVYDGNSWNSVTINNCESSYCWDIHMVIDDNDELHVAYTASSGSAKVIYMHYDGTSWTDTLVTVNALYGAVGIAVDSNNHPHISYAVDGQYCGDGLRLASYDGSSWGNQGIDIGSNRGCESAILIDENDHIYIAYQNRDNSKLKIATDKSGSWDSYIVDTGTSPSNLYPGYMTSMVMDGQGQFHIAHFDDKEDDLRYSTGAPNNQWTTTIVESSGHTGRDPSIALDSSGTPHIVYNSWAGWDLKYAVHNSTTASWDKSFISTTGDVGKGNSIIIDSNGVMHVAFSDEDSDVMKYATKSTGLSQTNEIRVQFGQYGSVTGTVVDDTTITVTTPLSGLTPDIIDITLWDKDDNSHILSPTFEFISQDDLDNDGVLNDNDDCPNDAGTSTQDLTGCPDDDGDGYSNSGDAFPSDYSEYADTDDDGVGDNADAFPNDATETVDSDGDGVGDNSDAFPSNAFEQADSDGDGVGDNSDDFPNDAGETTDTDGDGVGDNSDAFPTNAFEIFDSDGDGVGDNSDAFPNDASETVDSDGDGVGDNSDAYPNDASQTTDVDTDGDGVNDVNDLCSNTLENAVVDANGCSAMQLDADGDGVEDTEDDFPLDATQWLDSDGDGYGDNWGDSNWNDSRMSNWTGVFITGALQADYCPDIAGNSTADGYFGCLDTDGNGIADLFEQDETNETDTTNETELPVDTDGDGVSDIEDNCPATSLGTIVDAQGCELDESQDEDESNSAFESFFSGDSGSVTTTVGIGAILLALFTLLQTNAVAAILPDTFRWVQVLRKNSKLTKEERNELTYLQSLVQAYHSNPEELAEELVNLKGDLTARFTNNQIKKETREKLLVLIEELQSSTPNELYQIAHNDAYFGLSEVINTGERTKLLDEKLAMSATEGQQHQTEAPSAYSLGELDDKGTYWLEWPEDSGTWYYRYSPEDDWSIYENQAISRLITKFAGQAKFSIKNNLF